MGLAEARSAIRQSIRLTALVVRDYDEALEFFVGKLGFRLIEDTYITEQDKRWVVVAPPDEANQSLVRIPLTIAAGVAVFLPVVLTFARVDKYQTSGSV
jgi:catechol 2,3-dioxygenase-like lactoylglutathione lyase family enzyme